ncbi:MAG: DNA-binding protein [Planctomycetota bacterium]|jgi:integration host factor subunit beta
MATTTKKDLIERVSQETGVSRADSRKVVQSFLEAVIGELAKGNRLEFRDFGVFEIRERAGRVAQNPKTLERVAVPPRRSVRFKVGRLMQQSLETGVDGLVAVDGGDGED